MRLNWQTPHQRSQRLKKSPGLQAGTWTFLLDLTPHGRGDGRDGEIRRGGGAP